jgi:homogentisate 1,2-dioxygenase
LQRAWRKRSPLTATHPTPTPTPTPTPAPSRSWLYRIRPSVVHTKFEPVEHAGLTAAFGDLAVDPNQMRWFPPPLPAPDAPRVDFVAGLQTMAGAGDPTVKAGLAIHLYSANASMHRTAFYNSDGDFLIVPQAGALTLKTELGVLVVAPKEIAVVPRGVRFAVAVDGPSRGYVLEVFQGHFQLPDLGPIGANGLANARDFLYPVAAYEDVDAPHTVMTKFGGKLFAASVGHSPFDVVAWHGNYAPCKYDLSRFNTMNSVSYDHPDPSIYTVLTCPSDSPGTAVADFVIFPPRWMVMDKSFRPPYYHRNTMTEFMGMVWGKYDAKVGFQPGGASLHSCMAPHGPDAPTFIGASNADLKPEKFEGGLAFMFETSLMLRKTRFALDAPFRDVEYQKCWAALPKCFDPARRDFSGVKLGPTGAVVGAAAAPAAPGAADGAPAAAGAGKPAAGGGGAA